MKADRARTAASDPNGLKQLRRTVSENTVHALPECFPPLFRGGEAVGVGETSISRSGHGV